MVKKIYKILSLVVCFCLILEQVGLAQIAAQLDIAGHLAGLHSSFVQDKFRPAHLRYLSYDILTNNFSLLLDKGSAADVRDSELESTAQSLMKYFFTGLVLPNESFWVNLRPDTQDNIIDASLEQTDVGRIMLEADVQLKKDTAQYTSPKTPQGKEYWDKLYKKAGELLGSENITIPTLTRPWIVPGTIIITETKDGAYIYKATLKVMLEQDYLKGSAAYNFKDERLRVLNEYSSELIRELVIPQITKEVNSSKKYASLRQLYYSLIFAQWFKQKFTSSEGYYSQLIDTRDLTNLISKTFWSKNTYFQEYQKSFKGGEYNIKEPVYTTYGQTIRSYFSGGLALTVKPENIQKAPQNAIPQRPYQAGVDFMSTGKPNEGETKATLPESTPVDLQTGTAENLAGIVSKSDTKPNKTSIGSDLPTVSLIYEKGKWQQYVADPILATAQHQIINDVWQELWNECSGHEITDGIAEDMQWELRNDNLRNLPFHIHSPPDEGKFYDRIYGLAKERNVFLPPRGIWRIITHPGTGRNENGPRSFNLLIPKSSLDIIIQLRNSIMGNFNEAYKQWLFHEKIHLIVKARDKKGDEWSEKQVSDYAPIHKFIDLYSILSWKGRSVELEARATENTPEGWMTKEWIALDDFVTDTWGTLIKAQLSVPPFFIDDTLPSGVMYAVKEDGIYFNKQDILRLGAKSDIINVWWSAYEAWYEDNLTHHFNKFVPEQPTGYYSRKTFDERVQVVRNGIHEVELRLKDKAVLDVGTGDGPVAIAAALEGANPVCAIDPSEKGLNLARQNATRHSLTIKFLCLGLTNLSSLPLRQFDVAIVRNTLAYMPAELRKRAIMRIKDKIVPDGQIVIYENFDMREKAWRGKEWQHFLLECGLILVDTKVIISPSSGFPVSIIIVTKKSEKTSDSGGAEAIKPHSVRKMLTRPDELGFNPSAYDASSRLGGVYFGALPIINLADFNFDSFAAAPTVMPALNINKEFEEIQKLITANIRPSRQRIAEYLYACTHTQPSPFSLNYALSCIADVLRLEEE